MFLLYYSIDLKKAPCKNNWKFNNCNSKKVYSLKTKTKLFMLSKEREREFYLFRLNNGESIIRYSSELYKLHNNWLVWCQFSFQCLNLGWSLTLKANISYIGAWQTRLWTNTCTVQRGEPSWVEENFYQMYAIFSKLTTFDCMSIIVAHFISK